ncbi:tyrosine-type recombinase/integrase [Allokutzneria sp. A3M-2-11 16]|uniref:tyrosine-type recombinase/integrase n=1 Tax=Allokutzneria sp. A3M-2-11 16 TaxID=2962043 RepID=UPI0020B71DF4|nr:tyrosine-type recombinase/integrase [Allokutzneria sp. A3M-2-11 16]
MHDLLQSWALHMSAARLSKQTIKSYRVGVEQFLAWCETKGIEPALIKDNVNAFIVDLEDQGKGDATLVARQLAVRRFSWWLDKEDEIDRDRLLGLTAPRLDQRALVPLTEDEILALIGTCASKSFVDRRDEAVIRFMAETFVRAEETINMETEHLSLPKGSALIFRGKGGKGRIVPFGPQTARALDRYLRMRRHHSKADSPKLWLGGRGHTFGYPGLYLTLTRRAAKAGIPDFHPHRLRGTGATRWLERGGSEGGLMAVAGWSSRAMIDRYTRATKSSRAAEEARRLGLGDL